MADILAVDVNGTWQNGLNQIGNIVLKIIVFLVIMFIGWLIARALGKLADRLLDRIGFNRLADRSGLRRWTGNYRPSALAGKLVYYGLLLLALQLAFAVFGPNPISNMINSVVAWLPKLFIAIVIVIVAAAIANVLRDLVTNALGSLSYGRMIARAVQFGVIALGIIAALNQVGIATTVTMPVLIAALATLAGILIVGLGGGLVGPMRERWERALTRAEHEGRRVSQERSTQPRTGSSEQFGQSTYESRTGAAGRDVQRGGAQPGEAQPGGQDADTQEQRRRNQ